MLDFSHTDRMIVNSIRIKQEYTGSDNTKQEAIAHYRFLNSVNETVRGCIQKFPDCPPGARTANGTDLYH
jgi:hypothetical protein